MTPFTLAPATASGGALPATTPTAQGFPPRQGGSLTATPGTAVAPGTAAARRPRARSVVAQWITAAMVTFAVLQVSAFGHLDPVQTTMSDMVYAPGGRWLFPLMGALCLAGSAVVLTAVVRRRLIGPSVAMTAWCVGLALVVMFPTDPLTATQLSMAARIHRDGASAMFIAMPIAGWSVAPWSVSAHRRTGTPSVDSSPRRSRLLRAASVVCAAAGILQLLASIPSLAPGSAWAQNGVILALFDARGLVERVLFVTMLLVLLAVSRVVIVSRVAAAHRVAGRRTPTGDLTPPYDADPPATLVGMTHPAASADGNNPAGDAAERAAGTRRPGRWHQLWSALVLVITWPIGLALFILWTVVAALSILAIIAPLLVPGAAAIRRYAQAHRRWAARVLGRAVTAPYRIPTPGDARPDTPQSDTARPGLVARLKTILADPATWRDWLWLLVNSVVGFTLSLITVLLFLGGFFYLVYPLLYALTPQDVFGTVFGVYELHSVGQAFVVTPLAIVSFGLWWLLSPVLTRANALVIDGMLGGSERRHTSRTRAPLV